jgi:cyclic pyranopterin phosphate synthase
MRGGASDADLRSAIAGIWTARDDRYSEIRSESTSGWQKVEMSYIGG